MTSTDWNYDAHPGDCCARHEPDDTWSVCCRECAGTGVFPVPWISSPAEGAGRDDASCVRCKGSGRATVCL